MSVRTQLRWEVPPSVMARNIRTSVQKMARRMQAEMQKAAGQMQQFARSSHPWTNRTGAAEAGLYSRASGMVITYGHTVYYGVYLEFKYGGKWGVLPATRDYGEGLVSSGMRAALSELAG